MSTGRTLFGPAFARRFGIAWLAAGYVFLFLPIVSLLIFSFNNSPLPSVWAGFTLKWYAGLARDREMLSGLWLSLKVAFSTACASVVLGTLAAVTLVRYRRFTGRTLFSGMVSAPLVMPEVIVGLSLLLMLVSVQRALGFPERGARPRCSGAIQRSGTNTRPSDAGAADPAFARAREMTTSTTIVAR